MDSVLVSPHRKTDIREVAMRSRVLLLVLLVLEWAPQPHAAAQGAAELGRLEGQTFLHGTGAPLPEVMVTLTPMFSPPNPSDAPSTGVTRIPEPRSVFAGPDGRFVFEAVPAGQYMARPQLDGFFYADDTGAPSASTTFVADVSAGQTREIRLPMIPGGVISGRVNTPGGRPAIGLQIQPYRLAYLADGAPTLQLTSSRSVDDHGEFRLYHLSPGTYYLAATPNNNFATARGRGADMPPQEVPARTFYPSALDIGEARPLTLASGEEIEGVNIDIRNAAFATVSGKVLSTLPESAYEPPPPSAPRGTNPAAAQADSAAVKAALAALEQLRAQRGQPGPGGATTRPLPAAQLQLVPRDRRALQDPGIRRTLNAALASPNDGHFEFQNVPPGTYFLYASLPDNTAGTSQTAGSGVAARAYGRIAVDVGTADVSEVAVTVHHGVDVPGRIFTDGDANSLAGMKIFLQVDDSVYSFTANYQAEVREDGAFTIPIVPEAAYRVQAGVGSGALKQAFLLAVRQGDTDVFDSGFTVGDGPVVPIDVFVSFKSGNITGIIHDAEGRPVPKAVVALIPPPQRRHNPALYQSRVADAEGKFTMTGLPPGEFKLFAWRSIPTNAYRNAKFISAYEDSGLPVTIEAGGELRVDPVLAREIP
ncbi:MAG TPA: carboxypeptidase-like regulatory domain-containing protein [Terriglobia bacterium]|nr:carboxypeptidase-like regulatory domain-containing protein [Terriglobia bacterium]